MRILLIADTQDTALSGAGQSGAPAQGSPDELHALGLARQMRDGGRLAPLLACPRGSWLHTSAARLELPHLAVGPGAPGGLLALWRLARRLGKYERLFILTFGPRAHMLGRRLKALRGRRATWLAPAFLLRAPGDAQIRLRSADCAFCGSGQLAAKIAAEAPGLRLHLRAPGIGWQPAPRSPAPASRFVFGMDESLSPRSGALTVVRAMAALWQRHDLPPWEVRMYGEGERFSEILANASELGVASRLALLGEQDRAEALAQCSAWLAPGSSDAELPGTLWLGFAAGLPVVASESVLHLERLAGLEGCALLVPEGDAQAMAGAMIRLMREPDLATRLGLGASRAAHRCQLAEVCADWAGDIEEIMSAPARALA